jgi:hypothetical protein
MIDDWTAKLSKFIEIFQAVATELLSQSQKAINKVLEFVKNEFAEIRQKLTVIDYAFFMACLCAIGCAILIVFSGFGVLGYQSALWLQEGVWTELPLSSVFNYFFDGAVLQEWINNPQSWLGLHKIIDWSLKSIPLSLTLIFQGMIFVFITASFFFFSVIFRYIWIKNLN